MNEGIPSEKAKAIGRIASAKDANRAVEEGRADSLEAGAYKRLEMASKEMQEVIDDPSMPEPLRTRLLEVVKNMKRSEEGAKKLHEGKTHAEEVSLRDSLTGLPNESAFNEEVAVHINHAERFPDDILYALYIDIDKFKQINDTYGHDAGDKYLQLIAEHVRKAFRPDDIFARLHGDEFAALISLRNSSDTNTQKDFDEEISDITKRVHSAVYSAKSELSKFVSDNTNGTPYLEVSEYSGNASIGHARFEPRKDTKETFLKKADEAMYQAKQIGHI